MGKAGTRARESEKIEIHKMIEKGVIKPAETERAAPIAIDAQSKERSIITLLFPS